LDEIHNEENVGTGRWDGQCVREKRRGEVALGSSTEAQCRTKEELVVEVIAIIFKEKISK